MNSVFQGFYLLTLLQLHYLSITANTVHGTQPRTLTTDGVFTQLAGTPACNTHGHECIAEISSYKCTHGSRFTASSNSNILFKLIIFLFRTLSYLFHAAPYLRLCAGRWSRCCWGRRAPTGPGLDRTGHLRLAVAGCICSCSLFRGHTAAQRYQQKMSLSVRCSTNSPGVRGSFNRPKNFKVVTSMQIYGSILLSNTSLKNNVRMIKVLHLVNSQQWRSKTVKVTVMGLETVRK